MFRIIIVFLVVSFVFPACRGADSPILTYEGLKTLSMVPEDYPADTESMTSSCYEKWKAHRMDEPSPDMDPTSWARHYPRCSLAEQWQHEAWRGCMGIAATETQEKECDRRVADDRAFWLEDHEGWE